MSTVFVFGAVLTACTNSEKQSNQQEAAAANTTTCYNLVTDKDSVRLQLTMSGNQVAGPLEYKFYEKDQNKGTISGAFHGDTLIANYTFMSEGTESVREVAFLKKGNDLVEGYTDMEDQNNKLVFTDKATLDFSKGIILKNVSCN